MSEEVQKDENKGDNGVESGQTMKRNKLNKFFYTFLVVVIVIATFYVVKNRDKMVDPVANQDDSEVVNSEEGNNDNKINDIENITIDNITIDNIKSGDLIKSPVLVKGRGTAFENTLIVELRNSKHETVIKEFTTIKNSKVGEDGEYLITLHFQFRNTEEGYVAVYESSAKDGSELNLVEIPVKFKTVE